MRFVTLALMCVGVLLAAPTAAHATCYSSTPASAVFNDNPTDGGGLAPEITTVQASVDGACVYSVNPNIPGSVLVSGEGIFTYINRDGNAATGTPTFGGADIVVGVTGNTYGSDGPPLIGTWNGSTMDFNDPNPLPLVGLAGFSGSVDRLGIPTGVTTGIIVGTIYEGIYDDYFDFAPEPGQGQIPLAVTYSTTPPPPPPPPTPSPAPPSGTQDSQGESEDSTPLTRCKVPRTRGLTRTRAEDRLFAAGCDVASSVRRRYHNTVRRNRVITTSPAAGATTTRAVKITVSRGRRPKKKARKSDTASVAAQLRVLQERLTLARAMEQAARSR